ncbi:MAG: ABC transporter permease [Bdellovibrionaceae bacterium]|nr:ABC transporter permease [Bdellovibrionales bacterium]MCB9083417.1 ABC transporter permease [Pseudobdellovibrionaceae bacterium]
MTWNFFTRYLFSKRAGSLVRTIAWICIVGIGLGVLSLVVVLSVMNGFNGTIRERLLAVEPHLVVSTRSLHEGIGKNREDLGALRAEVSQLPGAHGAIVESQDVILRTLEGTFGGAVAKGMDGDSLEKIFLDIQNAGKKRKSPYSDFVMIEGNPDETEKKQEAKAESEKELVQRLAHLDGGEVILGVDLAHTLRIFEGDQILVIPPESLLAPAGETPVYEKVTVRALLSSRVADVDGKMMFYNPAHTLNRFRKSVSREVALEIRLPESYDFNAMAEEYRKRGFDVDTWVSRNEALFFALKMEKLAMTIFLALSALITCFSIVTVLVLLLTQKRRDLGILMAMGMSQARTRQVFTRVGMILSFFGMGGGLALGLGACYLLDKYPIEMLPDIYYDSSIPVKVTPELIYFVLGVAVVVAFLSSYLPARVNTSYQSSELLRYGRK